MNTISRNTINSIIKRLVREFNPDKIILFGSYAWGEPGPDSDIDLFVIVPESSLSPAKERFVLIVYYVD